MKGIEITAWMDQFLKKVNQIFKERIWFVGLQGSYGRDEATPTSDIDVVVILDTLSAGDIQAYNAMLDGLPYRERICGFLSGREELLHWSPSELFQFYYDTKPVQGSLDALLPLIDDAAVVSAIKLGAGNVFHGCVHNMLHEKSEDVLRGLYKSAVFVVQAICFRQTGTYISRLVDLRKVASDTDAAVVDVFLGLKNGAPVEFDKMAVLLFAWAQKWVCAT